MHTKISELLKIPNVFNYTILLNKCSNTIFSENTLKYLKKNMCIIHGCIFVEHLNQLLTKLMVMLRL